MPGLELLGYEFMQRAFLAGIAVAIVCPLVAALVAAVLGAVGIERLRARGKIAGDAAIAMFYTSGLALGVVLVSRAGGFNVNVLGYLFGSIAAVTTGDLLI